MLEQLGKDSESGVIARGLHQEVLACGSAKTLVQRDSGSLVELDTLTGSILTLPTPVKGMMFDVAVKLTNTSNSHIIKTGVAASEFLLGGVNMMTAASAVTLGVALDGTTHITLTMNGTTTGGKIGTVLRFTAINDTQWVVTGLIEGDAALATPATT